MVGHQVLDLSIGVRIPVPQLCSGEPFTLVRLSVRSFSEGGNPSPAAPIFSERSEVRKSSAPKKRSASGATSQQNIKKPEDVTNLSKNYEL